MLKSMIKNSDLWKNKSLYLMILPAALLLFLFAYLPLPGSIVAFKKYNFRDGIFGSPWVGWENFRFYVTSGYMWRTTWNTLWINFNSLLFGTLIAVTFAILLNEVANKPLRKLYQNFMFLPYFISFIVVAEFVRMLFSNKYGYVNGMLGFFGQTPVDWYISPQYWVKIIVGTQLWKTTGYTVVIYLAAITGIDAELFEAAALDGASRLQEIFHIMLPMLLPTIFTLALLEIGTIFFGNFQLIYSIVRNDHGILYSTTDIIDTYVFRTLRDQYASISVASAAGLYQSVCGFFFVFGSNALVKKYDKSYALF